MSALKIFIAATFAISSISGTEKSSKFIVTAKVTGVKIIGIYLSRKGHCILTNTNLPFLPNLNLNYAFTCFRIMLAAPMQIQGRGWECGITILTLGLTPLPPPPY